MPTYTSITRTVDLPPLGTREGPTLEFKAAVAGSHRFELAKDVGAMASAYGGVILVGAACDQATEQLKLYRKFTEEEAATAIRSYEEAVRDRCLPCPLIDPVRVPHPEGDGYVVAINVNPVLDQPVGVKIKSDGNDGKVLDAYVFHVRLSSQAIPIRPDQLAMLMNPNVRRTAILLAQIPPQFESSVLVYRHPRNQHDENPRAMPVQKASIDVMKNVFVATVQSGPGRVDLHIPFEDIDAVWANADGKWQVRVTGRVYLEGNVVRYASNPSNAVFR